MLFAFAARSAWLTTISASKPAAVRTNSPAGRACSGTDSGNRAVRSELALATGVLRGTCGVLARRARRRGDAGGDGAFHERCVDDVERGALVRLALRERGAGGGGRAAPGHQHHRP